MEKIWINNEVILMATPKIQMIKPPEVPNTMYTIENLTKWSNWYIAVRTNSKFSADKKYKTLHRIVKHCVLIEDSLLDQGWTTLQINQEMLKNSKK